MARLLLANTFIWEKASTMDFSETIQVWGIIFRIYGLLNGPDEDHIIIRSKLLFDIFSWSLRFCCSSATQISLLKPQGSLKPYFKNPCGQGKESCSDGLRHVTKMAVMPINNKSRPKTFIFRIPVTLKLCLKH